MNGMSDRFDDNPHYLQMIMLLDRLHTLTIEGRDETHAAEMIRSAMDSRWRMLSDEERAEIDKLSASLSMLEPR